jgi:glycosyltransferase involved in cell wall biosynthesis
MRDLQNARLCVDGRMLGPRSTGVGTYSRGVADAQRRLSGNAFVLDGGSIRGSQSSGRLRRWLRAAWPLPLHADSRGPGLLHAANLFQIAQVHFDLYGRLLTVTTPQTGGIMHWTYPVPLRLLGWHNIYTIHDAIPLTQPSLTPIRPDRHRRLLRKVVSAADAIVTVSETAKMEISNALGLDAKEITDCSLPVTIATASAPPFDLPSSGYLLSVGSVEPRKNIERLLQAHILSGVSMPLVIAGPATPQGRHLELAIENHPGVRRIDYVDPNNMGALIAHARALLMPSLAEGFGIPVAEAMTLGTPVVTSSAGALAETAGAAALLVSPHDVDAMAKAIRRIVNNDADHASLALAGLRNARRFSPDLFVERLGKVYSSVLATPIRTL